MSVRYIVRAKQMLSTPQVLSRILGARSTFRWPNRRNTRPAWDKDIFLTYPEPSEVDFRNFQELREYADVARFFNASKATQRYLMGDAGIRVPNTFVTKNEAIWAQGKQFVVRPYRHYGGRNYRVTNDRFDFREGFEYLSEVFPKRREYRIIYVMGKPTIVLRKKQPITARPEDAWNHANGSFFQTINDVEGSRLIQRTDIFDKLNNFSVIKNSHIIGVDVMLDKDGKYMVTEINACPSLRLENNLYKIAQEIRNKRNVR